MKTKKGKAQAASRRMRVLSMLEAKYEAFKNAHTDKKPWTSANGKYHKGATYEEECKRLSTEIGNIKRKLGYVKK